MNRQATNLRKSGAYSLPYIKEQTLAGMTLGRIDKGKIGTPEQVKEHIAAYNKLEPVLELATQSDTSYIEKSYLDSVEGRNAELADLLTELYKGTFSVESSTVNGTLRYGALAMAANTTPLLQRLEILLNGGRKRVQDTLQRTPGTPHLYFVLRRRTTCGYMALLRQYAQELRESYTPPVIDNERHGENVITASVEALRGTIQYVDTYRELDLAVRLDFFRYLMSTLGGILGPTVLSSPDQELEKIYIQYMKDEWPLWEQNITDLWSEALESKYKKQRTVLLDDLQLSVRHLSYDLLQRPLWGDNKHTELLRRIKPALLTAYYIREKDESGSYSLRVDMSELANDQLSRLWPRAEYIEFFYQKGTEQGLQVTVTYEDAEQHSAVETYTAVIYESGSFLRYEQERQKSSNPILLDKNVRGVKLDFQLIYGPGKTADPASEGSVELFVRNPRNDQSKSDDSEDYVINKQNVLSYLRSHSFYADYHLI